MRVLDAALAGDWDAFTDALAHLAQPALVLAYFSLSIITRMTRAFMLEALAGEYIVAARAKGLSDARILWRHAFGNIMVPLITVIALAYAGLLEGAVLTETVFSWPGIGLYLTGSLLERGHERRARRHPRHRLGLCRAQSPRRSRLSSARSARKVSETMSALAAWLLSEAPQSRRQASLGPLLSRLAPAPPQSSRDRGAGAALVLILVSLAAPLLATHEPAAQNLTERFAAPSAEHWLGTDEVGRDLYSRLLYGGRITLGMVVAIMVLVAPLGLAVGTVAGYAGGFADRALMRLTDIFLAFPRLILALAFVAALKPGITSAIIAIALTAWPPYARLARAETLTIRNSRLHRRGAPHRRLGGAHRAAPYRAASASRPRHRARHARHERHHPDRGGTRLSRHGRAAADRRNGAR